MSVRRLALVISPDARQDIRSLLMYSQQQWGREQRRTYKSNLDRAMKQLIRSRTVVGAHIVYYRVTDRSVIIVRVLHGKMDAASQLHS